MYKYGALLCRAKPALNKLEGEWLGHLHAVLHCKANALHSGRKAWWRERQMEGVSESGRGRSGGNGLRAWQGLLGRTGFREGD